VAAGPSPAQRGRPPAQGDEDDCQGVQLSQRGVEDEVHDVAPVLDARQLQGEGGYSPAQLADLQATIEAVPCDLVLLGTPIDLRRSLAARRPIVRVRYDVEEAGGATFEGMLAGL
jgi:hypothetical protein